MRDVLFGLLWVVLLPLAFCSPHTGVLIWIWVALLSPNDLLYGSLGIVPFNKLVAVAALLALGLSFQQKKKFYLDGLLVLIGLYVVVVFLSWVTQEEAFDYSDILFDKLWKICVLTILITGIMWSRHRLHQAVLAFAAGFAFLMVKEGLIFLFTAGGHKVLGTPSVGDNNSLALAILMTIPMALYAARYSAVPWVQWTFRAVACLGVVTVVATFSRGGFIGLVVMGFMLAGGSKHKVKTVLALAAVGALLYFVAPHDYVERLDTIKQASEDDSFTIRLVAWKINFLIARDHPFLGGGLAASLRGTEWSRHLTESTTFLFPTPAINTTYVAHSIYFQVLGDTGFTGLFIFLSILGTAYFLARRTIRIGRGDPALAWAADLGRALQISLIVYMVSGAALSNVYFEPLFILLALISRTYRTTKELSTAPAPSRLTSSPTPARLQPAYRGAF